MAIPVVVYSNMALAGNNLTKTLQPEYEVIKVVLDKTEAVADLPALFSSGAAKALVVAGLLAGEDADADEVEAAVTAAQPGVRVARLSRADLEGAGIQLLPPGASTEKGFQPEGAPRPDPAIFPRLFKAKLAGI
ncbi:hypothetical protein HMPREF1624_08258 [Sporothrix schenckii ATCC 58251]|uniref:Uncharacterized protein n=2 Tax=Sporothrix schenckii TaxID=29908 RepID=U7PLL6_SPOS1|nr:hypothetical protein HMPREF1624_08258 [Sporothrix schenckii ATCC 58251]